MTEGPLDDVAYELPAKLAIAHQCLGKKKPERTAMLPLVSDLPCYSDETLLNPFITLHYKLNMIKDTKGNSLIQYTF